MTVVFAHPALPDAPSEMHKVYTQTTAHLKVNVLLEKMPLGWETVQEVSFRAIARNLTRNFSKSVSRHQK
jgi:DNA-binding transcriptional regulator YbjK